MMQLQTLQTRQTLQTLQSAFQDALLQDQSLGPDVLGTRGVQQFGVYRSAYRARLRAALRDNFEVLPLVMGDKAFDALAHAYIEAHPSGHYSLRWFGHQLCTFMQANATLVEHPALVDLARMEWALRQAFDAATVASLTAAELATVPAADWAGLLLTLHPSVQLLDLQWAIGPTWNALKAGSSKLDPPEALNHHLLVWRQGMNTQWKSLNPTEVVFVQCLLAGQHFSQVCEALAHSIGEDGAATAAASLLGDLLNTGALGALQSHPSEISHY